MNDDIIIALDLVDDESSVTDFHVVKNIKFITLEKNLTSKFCPVCHCRLHSKGKFTRHPNNPVLQDGYKLDVTLIGRRWFCSNPDCDYTENDEFPFIEPRKRNTKIVPLLIVYALKDIHLTCREVAIMFNTSDTYVHNTFMHLICPKRKPLPSIISIDEVYLNTSPTCKYALVILDWKTKEVIDLLPSRRKNYTEKYFLNIPKKERDNVKFLICDMYNPYINYTTNDFIQFFRSTCHIVDIR